MAYSKQNFQNGQILNAANLEAMENGIIAGQGAHNLLDNSDFRNPVAQAGIGGKHGGKTYVCDRWYDTYGYGTYSLNEGVGITLSYGTNHCYCVQKINNASQYYGKTMTLAIQLSNGTIYVNSGTYLSSSISLKISGDNWEYDLFYDRVELVVVSDSITVSWIALYEGSYTAETLPSYVPKGKHVEMLNCGVSLAPHNLLDNSDFTNPVNQRNSAYYTNGNEYTIDRWKTQYGTNISIENGYVNIWGNWDLKQRLKKPLGIIYTLAAKVRINFTGDNTPAVGIDGGQKVELDAPIGEWRIYAKQIDISSITDETIEIQLAPNGGSSSGSISVEWVALYEGSYDASTLPAYQPKGYAAELAEAQRYYQTIPALTHISGVTNTTTSFGAKYRIPTMRIAPTVSIASGQEVSIYTGDYSATTANYTMQYASKINQITFNVSLSAGSFVAYKPGELTFPVDIVLSADL